MDIKDALWVIGVKAILMAMYKMPKDKAEKLVGKWDREYPSEAVFDALIALVKKEPIDPIPYIQACLKNAPKAVKEDRRDNEGEQWKRRVQGWREKKVWPPLTGPKPGEDGCMCPPEYLIGN